jgi:hypothetical protein
VISLPSPRELANIVAPATFALSLGLCASAELPKGVTVDLTQIGHIASKGRVQDADYNRLPEVDALIQAGAAAIPFLVQSLEDETEIQHSVVDFWPRVRVGDVALIILCDFFKTSDWTRSTIPGLSWDTLLERPDRGAASWEVLGGFLAKHGRRGLRNKVESILEPYQGRLSWDATERCFKPTTKQP